MIHASGEDVEVAESFTYLGSMFHDSRNSLDDLVLQREERTLSAKVFEYDSIYAEETSIVFSRFRYCQYCFMEVKHGR